MSAVPSLTPLVAAYDHVLLDLDGCVYVGDEATPGAVQALAALRAAGKGIAFVTNEGRRSGEEFVRKLWSLGFRASLEEVVTVGGAVQHVLAERRERWRTAYVIGAPVMHQHVLDAGCKIANGRDVPAVPDVVVVAAHDRFDYDELRDATQAVLGGAALICAGADPVFPTATGLWPGTGAVVAAVEAATGVRAENVGKPAAQPFLTALDRLGPGRALVVGDRLDSDLAGAAAAGLDGAIVLSGATGAEEAHAASDPTPVAVAATLAELVLGRMHAA
ncbi:MAG TPA: HAD-IIA family hydrolase [Baekduia sp.]|uniref:HAD-IIA family hydrolase n=1 Tax=Baekduia sp. TaxID=2600305 RepID=UPI002D782F65|nr:HAD-IIA family hydrolase [Baekduia sp.]HET6509291.1 HAD-IIA family hydrolase [Baekduia sp.]